MLVEFLAPSRSSAGTPYEAQISGFMVATLETIIRGEFSGHRDSNIDTFHLRRACQPDDYADLRATVGNRGKFIDFHRRCKLAEPVSDQTHVHATAYLPAGHCEPLKTEYLRMLDQHVFSEPGSGNGEWVSFDYKGSRYGSTSRTLARWAQLQTTCLQDGALRVSAPRKRPAPDRPPPRRRGL